MKKLIECLKRPRETNQGGNRGGAWRNLGDPRGTLGAPRRTQERLTPEGNLWLREGISGSGGEPPALRRTR